MLLSVVCGTCVTKSPKWLQRRLHRLIGRQMRASGCYISRVEDSASQLLRNLLLFPVPAESRASGHQVKLMKVRSIVGSELSSAVSHSIRDESASFEDVAVVKY
jgi:hypothetical protein